MSTRNESRGGTSLASTSATYGQLQPIDTLAANWVPRFGSTMASSPPPTPDTSNENQIADVVAALHKAAATKATLDFADENQPLAHAIQAYVNSRMQLLCKQLRDEADQITAKFSEATSAAKNAIKLEHSIIEKHQNECLLSYKNAQKMQDKFTIQRANVKSAIEQIQDFIEHRDREIDALNTQLLHCCTETQSIIQQSSAPEAMQKLIKASIAREEDAVQQLYKASATPLSDSDADLHRQNCQERRLSFTQRVDRTIQKFDSLAQSIQTSIQGCQRTLSEHAASLDATAAPLHKTNADIDDIILDIDNLQHAIMSNQIDTTPLLETATQARHLNMELCQHATTLLAQWQLHVGDMCLQTQ